MSKKYIETKDGRKLNHIVESAVVMPPSMYEQLSDDKIPEKMKESIKKEHFSESENTGALKLAISLRESAKPEDKPAFDKIINKLREKTASTEKKLWKFPISRFGNVNGNGRIYPRALWENVINNQRDTWCGTYGLADHPIEDDDPGQFKNAAIVWLDMMIDDANKLIWAIGSFVGTYGRLAQEIIEAGGKIGFSSSGYGECLSDGCTVNPDTYIIERPADIVTNPSQLVFGDASNESYNPGNVEYTKQTMEGASVPENKITEAKSNILKGKTMNKTVGAVKMGESNEAKAGPVAIDKLTKKVIEKQVESMINDTDKNTNPAEKLTEVNELLKMVKESQDEDLISKVEEKLVKTRDELYSLVEAASKVENEFGNISEMAENTKKAVVTGKLLSEQVEDYKTLVEGLETKVQTLGKENSLLKAKLALKESREASNTKAINDAKVKNQQLEESTSAEIANLKNTILKLNKANRKLESENGVYKTRLSHTASTIKTMTESTKQSDARMRKANDMIKKVVAEKEAYRQKCIRLQTTIKENELKYNDLNKKFEDYKESNQEKISFKPIKKDYVSEYLNLKENHGLDVENYWNDLLTQYGESIKPFERQIRGAKTYNEAFNQFMKYLPRIDESMGAAEKAEIDPSISSLKERREILKEAGMERSTELDDINAAELENMKKMGLN